MYVEKAVLRQPCLTVGRAVLVMKIPYHVYNAFTHGALGKGNPAGVVNFEFLLEYLPNNTEDPFWSDEATALCQEIATKLNLSETAFVRDEKSRPVTSQREDNPHGYRYDIRYFTPTQEIEFCGHATLSAADYVAWKRRLTESDTLTISYEKGTLPIKFWRENNGHRRMYEMRANASEAEMLEDVAKEAEVIAKIRNAFGENSCPGSQRTETGASLFSLERNPMGDTFFRIHVTTYEELLLFHSFYMTPEKGPDMEKLAKIAADIGGRGICVFLTTVSILPGPECAECADSSSRRFDFDCYIRWFGPNVGIPEDPVTGSACCGIAPFLPPKTEHAYTVYQCSTRGGLMYTLVCAPDKVSIGGAVGWEKSGTLERSSAGGAFIDGECHETDAHRHR